MAKAITLLDGGLGQELYRRGVRKHEVLWSANALVIDPDAVRDVHVAFIRAGAQVIITNTYCTSRVRLGRAGFGDRFEELNALACRLAQEARDEAGVPGVQIAGCLPPLHGSYRPDLVPSIDEMLPQYREMAAIIGPMVDLMLCETMATASEGLAAATAAAETGKPVWVSWTLRDDGQGMLRSDETIDQAVAALDGLPAGRQPEAFLVNCCAPESVGPALDRLRALTDRPIGAYANGFEPIPEKWRAGNIDALDVRRDLDPPAYAAFVGDWIARGATLIGGCCEIGPAHIKYIARIIEDLRDAA